MKSAKIAKPRRPAQLSVMVALFDEWARLERARYISDDECDQALERMIEIERIVTATPAANATDMLIKAKIARYNEKEGAPEIDGRPDETRDVLSSLIRYLDRAVAP